MGLSVNEMRALDGSMMNLHHAGQISRIILQGQEGTWLGLIRQCEEAGASFSRSNTQHGRIVDVKRARWLWRVTGSWDPVAYFAAKVLIAAVTKGVAAAAALGRCAMMNRLVRVRKCWVISATSIYSLISFWIYLTTCCFFRSKTWWLLFNMDVIFIFFYFSVDRHFWICAIRMVGYPSVWRQIIKCLTVTSHISFSDHLSFDPLPLLYGGMLTPLTGTYL